MPNARASDTALTDLVTVGTTMHQLAMWWLIVAGLQRVDRHKLLHQLLNDETNFGCRSPCCIVLFD